ncbi:NAD-dependent deacetylase [Acidobacteria bacterium ACD]|nr:NAD-dependent deacetylase [Acidobacteria bacterium ACD]
MGVDAGLPDFRGPQGFWQAYPAFQRLGLRFEDLASPRWFEADPGRAWGFYGHRLELYRRTEPHDAYTILLRWARSKPAGGFVFTSNVDGLFQKAGFADEQVVECHGSIHHLQCLSRCGIGLFAAEGQSVPVDLETVRALPPLPSCPACGGLARPAILMFGDWGFDDARTSAQEERFDCWLRGLPGAPVVVELGAGTRIVTVRWTGERIARHFGSTLVRINPREASVPAPAGGFRGTGLPLGALEAVRRIDERLGG